MTLSATLEAALIGQATKQDVIQAIDDELKALECPHPPTRLYSWHVGDTLCVGCCECGAVLAGNAAQKVDFT